MMINVGIYDVVRLKDGRDGTIVEVYDNPIGYEVEISESDMELVTVTIEQIEEVIWKSK